MATNLKPYNLRKSEALLDQYNFALSKYDAVVFLKESERTSKPIHTGGEIITVGFRTVINSLSIHNEYLVFDYNTSKTATWSYPYQARKTANYTDEEWFDIFEHIAVTMAKEVGLKKILVDTGRTDNRFLKSKGYTRDMNYTGFNFYKSVKDILADRPDITEA